jgi:hypothetical protein
VASAPTTTPQVGAGGMLSSPMAKGILGGIAEAGLMNMLTGPHYYSGGLFGAPGMGGFFGRGPYVLRWRPYVRRLRFRRGL